MVVEDASAINSANSTNVILAFMIVVLPVYLSLFFNTRLTLKPTTTLGGTSMRLPVAG